MQTAPHATMGDEIRPFKVEVPQAALDDLRQRLAMTRWPERETTSDWSQGAPLDRMQALVSYWAQGYDWRAAEAKLNAFPQFRTQSDGLGIHFLHVRSKHENALPIILTHGWPGSVFEFLKVMDRWSTRQPTAARSRTLSMSSCRHCRVTAFRTQI